MLRGSIKVQAQKCLNKVRSQKSIRMGFELSGNSKGGEIIVYLCSDISVVAMAVPEGATFLSEFSL